MRRISKLVSAWPPCGRTSAYANGCWSIFACPGQGKPNPEHTMQGSCEPTVALRMLRFHCPGQRNRWADGVLTPALRCSWTNDANGCLAVFACTGQAESMTRAHPARLLRADRCSTHGALFIALGSEITAPTMCSHLLEMLVDPQCKRMLGSFCLPWAAETKTRAHHARLLRADRYSANAACSLPWAAK